MWARHAADRMKPTNVELAREAEEIVSGDPILP
jgi:hypothetical protein